MRSKGSLVVWSTLVGVAWLGVAPRQASSASDAHGQPEARCGRSLAQAGERLVIGCPEFDAAAADSGAAFVFARRGSTWSPESRLVPADGAETARFGHSVALAGDTAVVGAPGDGALSPGAAYVFVRSGSTWTQQGRLAPADAAAGDFFGFSVAVVGDTALVGAIRDDHAGGEDAGSVYVFVRSGSTWKEEQKLTADAAARDYFGIAAAVSGDTAVVGSLRNAHGGRKNAGAAYVFVRSASTWREQQKLVASDAAAGDEFGGAVAVAGDTVVVGAGLDDQPTGEDAGSAYVFVRSGAKWNEQQKLAASDAAAIDEFGHAVAVSGDTALVGAFDADHPGGEDAGAAYVFVRSGSRWSEQRKLVAGDAASTDRFGVSASLSGDTAVVGAFLDDQASGADAGSAYVDAGSAYVLWRAGSTWSEQQNLVPSDPAAQPQPVLSEADRAASRRTMNALREVGQAMANWATDELDRPGWTEPAEKQAPAGANWSLCPRISYEELQAVLVPGYLEELPRQDGWGHPLDFCLDRAAGRMHFAMGVRSPGRDDRFEGSDYAKLGKFHPALVDRDVVWLDGLFVTWPER